MALITLDQAKAQLRIDTCDQDVHIMLVVNDATAIILEYIDRPEASGWDEDTVPGPVRTAILHELAYLWENRGDRQVELAAGANAALPPTVVALLDRTRVPVFA